ncbi:MAG: WD40/YVTN/BNR-like repeat-containing protein [Neisseriaceae bacterium]
MSQLDEEEITLKKNTIKNFRILFFIIACCLLTACGSGGNSNINNSSPQPTSQGTNFLILGDNGTIANYNISSDQINSVSESMTPVAFFDAESVSGNLIISGVGGMYNFSTQDGKLKFERKSISGDPHLRLYRILHANGKFVTVGNIDPINTLIAYSDDGESWVYSGESTIGQLTGIAYSNNKFIAVGPTYYSLMYTSITGDSWSTVTSPIFSLDITNGAGRFVMIGTEGTVATSLNFESWEHEHTVTKNNLIRVVYGNGKFVAVGKNGTIISSNDGKSWSLESSVSTDNLNSIAYGDNHFVAVGNQGTIITSIDGKVWKKLSPPNNLKVNYYGIKYTGLPLIKIYK